jgi:urease accessory protein
VCIFWSKPFRAERVRRNLASRSAQATVAVCLALLSASAYAHSTVKGVGDFYGGFLHPLTALEHVLAFLALGILAGQQGTRAQAGLPVFWIALMIGATLALWVPNLPLVDLANIASALVFGALIAAALPLPTFVYLGLCLLFGLSHGYANGSAITPLIKPYLFIPGIGLAGLVTTGYGMIVTDYVLRRKIGWMTIAVRVSGSWIAAIGLLVLATSWKRLVG